MEVRESIETPRYEVTEKGNETNTFTRGRKFNEDKKYPTCIDDLGSTKEPITTTKN